MGGIMSNFKVILLCTILILLSISARTQNLLYQPESIVYDASHNRYLVSNWGNGDIIQIDDEGNQSNFNTAPAHLAGLHIVDNTLYAASNLGEYAGLLGFDLETGEMVMHLVIDGQDILNGITSDNSGNLYVTDWDDGGPGGNKIYQVNIAEETYTEIVSYMLKPNGIEFDEENNRLLVISNVGINDTFYSISLDDFGVEYIRKADVDGDGLTRDNQGYIYISSWTYDAIYRFSPDFSSGPELIETGLNNPADINFNKSDNILPVPNFGNHSISLITFEDVDDDGVIDINDNCPDTPNPHQEDSDDDGYGDVCDICPGFDDDIDSDDDGVPDGCDICPGYDDSVDGDDDGVPDDCDNCPEDYNPEQEDMNGNSIGDICDYTCGDPDGDELINILDVVFTINYLYKNGASPEFMQSFDVNNDADVNILDVVYLINFLYKSGPEPDCP
jgi:sugar lactone lactonase YvrE